MESVLNITTIPDIKFSDGSTPDQLIVETPPNAHRPKITLRQVSPGLRQTIESLQHTGASVPLLIGKTMQSEGPAAIGKLTHYLKTLSQHALLRHTLTVDGIDWLTIEPTAVYYRFDEQAISNEKSYMLSRFACIRNDNGQLLLESPLGFARILVHGAAAMTAIHHLSRAQTPGQLHESCDCLDEATALQLLSILANGGALAESPDGSNEPDADDPIMKQWEFHDLLFHSRVRLGRHSQPYGGTYPYVDKFESPPLMRAPLSDEYIELEYPDIDKLRADDLPFTEVLEARASLREQGDPPLNLKQLGEFLYRSARIKTFAEPAGVSWRPSPGGGAIHELDIYPLISNCDGIEPGLYHYNPRDHFLSRAAQASPMLSTLAQIASITAQMEQPPQVLLLVTARFQRIQIKYQSMGYAVMLKNLGALYQTFYLVATAMGLSPTALGGGHSDLFNQVTGINYYEETTIGEFILNSRLPGDHSTATPGLKPILPR
ncbi:MAG: SagB family peptide dehydrogenase [Proteobacteria bacterium]|jgi:SagB-type dehydrogenase family enzyme|nr:SagB family peptide dehydrogenase [Pseudomonadota bacterium]